MKRIRAAWRAFLNPTPTNPQPLQFALKVSDPGGARIMRAIIQHQRRNGRRDFGA